MVKAVKVIKMKINKLKVRLEIQEQVKEIE
jgi:hypothetical protein